LFRAKNGDVIRRIQDGLDCCGLHTKVDMAWPFPSKDNLADACIKRFERERNCFEVWRAEERGVAGMAVGVVVGVVVWKILVLYAQSRGAAWHNQENGANDSEHAEERNGGRRQLEYPAGQSGRYQDEPDVENEDAMLASSVHPSHLGDGSDPWQSERHD